MLQITGTLRGTLPTQVVSLTLHWCVQIRCGDLYADKAVEAFTACAVSDKKCVPQRVDQSSYPEPPPCALDEKFDLNNFQVLHLLIWMLHAYVVSRIPPMYAGPGGLLC